MTSNIKPVGLYYEKKQPNQIEPRNQLKTHDEIDRKRLENIRCDCDRDHSYDSRSIIDDTVAMAPSLKLRPYDMAHMIWGHFSNDKKMLYL